MSVWFCKRAREGFTIMELLVVVAIIGILASVILIAIGDTQREAHQRAAQQELRNIHAAIELMRIHTGQYPHGRDRYCPPRDATDNEVNLASAAAGLTATDGSHSSWDGPYITEAIDPWGNPYFLDEDYYCTAGAVGCQGIEDSDTDTSALISCGPNGSLGTNPGYPDNSPSCAYDDDNIVYVLCRDI